MEHALAWLEPPDLPPVVSVFVPEAPAGATEPSGCRTAPEVVRFDGLMGPTPTPRLIAVDLLLSPGARASSLNEVVPPGAAIARQTALWVHTGRMRPPRPAVVVPPRRRVHAAATVHRQRLADRDLVRLSGVLVTTRVRTAVDLLCYASRELAVTGTKLLLATGVDVEQLLVVLSELEGLPTRRARALLAVAAPGSG